MGNKNMEKEKERIKKVLKRRNEGWHEKEKTKSDFIQKCQCIFQLKMIMF